MLLKPITSAMAGNKASLRFTINQKTRKAIIAANIKGKAYPRNEINHHRCGLSNGAKQASKKSITTILLIVSKNVFVIKRNLLAIKLQHVSK